MRIILRSLEKSDLAFIKSWRNDSLVFPFVREYRYLSDFDQEKWFQSYTASRRDSDWGQELMVAEGFPIVCGFVRIEWKNRRAELSFLYAGKNREVRLEFLKQLIEIGFKRFGFNKVTWPVYGHDLNLPLYKTVLKEEAVLKEEYFWDGKFYDRHYLSLTRSQYESRQ